MSKHWDAIERWLGVDRGSYSHLVLERNTATGQYFVAFFVGKRIVYSGTPREKRRDALRWASDWCERELEQASK
jgi:hypothetical protein